MAIPIMPGVYRAPGSRRRRSVSERVKRRARELGLLARQMAYDAMVRELCHGKLDEELIESWEPPTFDHALLRHELRKAQDALQAAISMSAVLFP